MWRAAHKITSELPTFNSVHERWKIPVTAKQQLQLIFSIYLV